jgi:hypothetical protein
VPIARPSHARAQGGKARTREGGIRGRSCTSPGRSFPIPCHTHPSFLRGPSITSRLSPFIYPREAPRTRRFSPSTRFIYAEALDSKCRSPRPYRRLTAAADKRRPPAARVVNDWLCPLSEHCASPTLPGRSMLGANGSPDHGADSALTQTSRRCNMCPPLAGRGACMWMLSLINISHVNRSPPRGQVVSLLSSL